jgi:hypothetical protein
VILGTYIQNDNDQRNVEALSQCNGEKVDGHEEYPVSSLCAIFHPILPFHTVSGGCGQKDLSICVYFFAAILRN